MTGADKHFESFTGLDSANPALRQHALMEKGVAGTIGEFDKAKPLLGAEPFDHSMDWRAGRCLEPGLAEARSSSKGTGLRLVGFNVEVTTPRITES